MKAYVRYGVITLLAYIIFMFALLPANRVYPLLKENTAFPVSLHGISGTVWNGSAAVVQINRQQIESLSWNFHPLALLLARIEMELAFHIGDGRAELIAGRSLMGGAYIKDATAKFSLAELEPLLLKNPLGLTGSFSMQLENIKIEGNHIAAAEGTLQLKNIGIGSSADLVIGNFNMTFETTEEGVKGVLKDAGGLIKAEGLLLLKPDGNYKLTASIVSRDSQRTDIRQALQFLGRPSPTGKVTLTRAGKFEVDKYLPF